MTRKLVAGLILCSLPLGLAGCGTGAQGTVASCADASIRFFRDALAKSNSEAEFKAAIKDFSRPAECDGLSRAEMEVASSRLQAALVPDLFAAAARWGGLDQGAST